MKSSCMRPEVELTKARKFWVRRKEVHSLEKSCPFKNRRRFDVSPTTTYLPDTIHVFI